MTVTPQARSQPFADLLVGPIDYVISQEVCHMRFRHRWSTVLFAFAAIVGLGAGLTAATAFQGRAAPTST
jgi:hypothetical protein